MSVILDAAGGQAFSDPEIISAALEVLVHVVCPPPALAKPPAHATGGEATPGPNRGLVGDLRISLGTGGGGAGLASLMEQGFKQAREAVRQHNGIKVLLSLLHPRTALPPPTADVVRALACQALLGLARDPAIAHILTKLQVSGLSFGFVASSALLLLAAFGDRPRIEW
jgi:HIV-1 Vpr-binding protein